MLEPSRRTLLGPFVLTRPAPPGRTSVRWLAIRQDNGETRLVHVFSRLQTQEQRDRFSESMSRASAFEHAHVLPIEEFGFDGSAGGWASAPYPGDADGLLTLGRLVRIKGGRMSREEAERAVLQLLDVVACAHAAGRRHGPIDLDEVLVDRSGSLLVDLYGVWRDLENLSSGNAELERDEVRSVVEIAYRLITGLVAEGPLIAASRLAPGLDSAWDAWFEAGLDPSGGFDSARHALKLMPAGVGLESGEKKTGSARRHVWGRLRSVIN